MTIEAPEISEARVVVERALEMLCVLHAEVGAAAVAVEISRHLTRSISGDTNFSDLTVAQVAQEPVVDSAQVKPVELEEPETPTTNVLCPHLKVKEIVEPAITDDDTPEYNLSGHPLAQLPGEDLVGHLKSVDGVALRVFAQVAEALT